MSVAYNESQQGCCEECEDRADVPESQPRMPIVEFGPDGRVWVHRFESTALIAFLARPEDESFDARGIPVTRVGGEEYPHLEARGEGHPAELQVRFMTALRAMVEGMDVPASDEAEVAAILDWLDDAPNLSVLLLASEVGDGVLAYSLTCKSGCSPWGKLFDPHCCKT